MTGPPDRAGRSRAPGPSRRRSTGPPPPGARPGRPPSALQAVAEGAKSLTGGPRRRARRLASSSNGAVATPDADTAPTPVVKIDNMSDAFATKVSVEFGDRLGELLDTVGGRAVAAGGVHWGGGPRRRPR